MSISNAGNAGPPHRPKSLDTVKRPDAGRLGAGHDDSPTELRRKTAQGALAAIVGQAANFILRIASMVVLARLVTPEHFGLVGMVTAITGFLGLFRDAGLGQATVQRATIDDELTSSMFWINLGVGVLLALLTAFSAPLVAAFYGDPRLIWITVALASGFVFNGAAAQHRALVQRNMRFGVLAAMDIAALLISIIVGTWMAIADMGYWALVGMAVSLPAASLVGLWLASGWMPGPPRRGGTGVRSMLHYGGLVTLNGVVVYIAYNVDKVLLGRVWGAEILGLYGRAYQLINIPTENLNTTIGWVLFPVLSRVQNYPQRLRAYFLKGYGLYLSAVMPITVACGLLAEDIVLVLLGPQWSEAVPVFRLLAPTILAFAMINPFGYLMQATGRAMRSLKLACLIAPVAILGYVIGLPGGSSGVALGFSTAMLVLVVPVAYWARRDTLISGLDLLRAIFPPLLAALAGALAAFGTASLLDIENALLRLVILTLVLFATHAFALLVVFGQRREYAEILRVIRGQPVQLASEGDRA